MLRNYVCLFWFCLLLFGALSSCNSKIHYANFSQTNRSQKTEKANPNLPAALPTASLAAQIPGSDSVSDASHLSDYVVPSFQISSQKKAYVQQDAKLAALEVKKEIRQLLKGKKRLLQDEKTAERKIPVSVYLSVAAAAVSILSLFLISSSGAFVFLWLFSTIFGFFTSIAAIEYVNRRKSEFKGQGFAIAALLVCVAQLVLIIALLLAFSGGGH